MNSQSDQVNLKLVKENDKLKEEINKLRELLEQRQSEQLFTLSPNDQQINEHQQDLSPAKDPSTDSLKEKNPMIQSDSEKDNGSQATAVNYRRISASSSFILG